MSYILDALKKAESERKLGSIPTLHTQSLTAPVAFDVPVSDWRQPRHGWLLALPLSLILALAWFKPWQPDGEQTQSTAPISRPITALPAPPDAIAVATPIAAKRVIDVDAQPTIASAEPNQDSDAAKRAAVANLPDNTAPTTARSTSANAASAVLRAVPKAKDARYPVPPIASAGMPADRNLPSPTAPKIPAKSSDAVSSAAAPETSLPTLRQLPESLQREIPELAVGGFLYSRNAAERTIIINRALRHEGDEIAPGLVLEKMMPHVAVLTYRGYRYRINY